MPHCPSAGIKSMSSIHCYSTIKNAIRPHEYSTEFAPPLDQVVELYGEHVLPHDGVITLTDKPGLGIDHRRSRPSQTIRLNSLPSPFCCAKRGRRASEARLAGGSYQPIPHSTLQQPKPLPNNPPNPKIPVQTMR